MKGNLEYLMFQYLSFQYTVSCIAAAFKKGFSNFLYNRNFFDCRTICCGTTSFLFSCIPYIKLDFHLLQLHVSPLQDPNKGGHVEGGILIPVAQIFVLLFLRRQRLISSSTPKQPSCIWEILSRSTCNIIVFIGHGVSLGFKGPLPAKNCSSGLRRVTAASVQDEPNCGDPGDIPTTLEALLDPLGHQHKPTTHIRKN